jgi:hypothetical protein
MERDGALITLCIGHGVQPQRLWMGAVSCCPIDCYSVGHLTVVAHFNASLPVSKPVSRGKSVHTLVHTLARSLPLLSHAAGLKCPQKSNSSAVRVFSAHFVHQREEHKIVIGLPSACNRTAAKLSLPSLSFT